MTEREVLESGRKALVGKMMMARVGRARERGETQGFMKILIDAKRRESSAPLSWGSAATRLSNPCST